MRIYKKSKTKKTISYLIPNPPENDDEFFIWLKTESEKLWEDYGIKWNPGLYEKQIDIYEKRMKFKFPKIFRTFLKHMNGTNKGHPDWKDSNFHRYDKDITEVKNRIDIICKEFDVKKEDIDGEKIPYLMPLFFERYLVIDKNKKEHPVISQWFSKDELFFMAHSLKFYLISEIFNVEYLEEDKENIYKNDIKFWSQFS